MPHRSTCSAGGPWVVAGGLPVVDPCIREALRGARKSGADPIVRQVQDERNLPVGSWRQRRSRSVAQWTFPPEEGTKTRTLGNLSIGFDRVDDESFAYNTLEPKRNTLRLFFENTSGGSFPTGDWRIRANDTTDGGASLRAVKNANNGRSPLRIEAQKALLDEGSTRPETFIHRAPRRSRPNLRSRFPWRPSSGKTCIHAKLCAEIFCSVPICGFRRTKLHSGRLLCRAQTPASPRRPGQP